jgi:capsid protein
MGIKSFVQGAMGFRNRNLQLTTQRPGGASIPDIPERDMTTTDRLTAMAKARQCIEENPLTTGMIVTGVDNVVGTGYNLRMLTEDKDYNNEVERRFQEASASKQLDVRGKRTWGELQKMWWVRRAIDGDVGVIKKIGLSDDGRALSQAQTIEADRIRKNGAMMIDDVGIDFDAFGKALTYYAAPRVKGSLDVEGTIADGKPVPAEQFIFYDYDVTERTERKRGVTMLLQDFNLLKDFEQILNAMLQKVKNESFMGLEFRMEASPSGSLFGDSEVEATSPDGKQRKHVKMVNGVNIRTQPGESVNVLGTKSPHGDWINFIRLVFRLAGSPLALPLEMFLLDFNDTNFSGGRAIIEIAKRHFRIEQKCLEAPSNDFFNWWLENEIKFNGLVVPASLQTTWASHKWGKPGWPYLDPKKDVEAQALQIANGLTTRQRILDETTGEDWETDVAAGLARENEILKDLGISIAVGQPGNTIENENESGEDEPEKEEE